MIRCAFGTELVILLLLCFCANIQVTCINPFLYWVVFLVFFFFGGCTFDIVHKLKYPHTPLDPALFGVFIDGFDLQVGALWPLISVLARMEYNQ
jgi:hypothetical protein